MLPEGMSSVLEAALPMNLFTRRMLPKVPLAMTASLPRLEPKLLKSLGESPLLARNLAAGEVRAMEPAGKMWSVVHQKEDFEKI